MLKIDKYRVEIELIEPMLGTVPKNREVWTTHIQDKQRKEAAKSRRSKPTLGNGEEPTPENMAVVQAEEAETVPDDHGRGWTGFHEQDGVPLIYDYVIKGFLGEAAQTLKESSDGEDGEEVKQLKSRVKRYVFVPQANRRIWLPKPEEMDEDGKPVFPDLQRPLRADTALGPRVTVVRSDLIQAGTRLEFGLHVLPGGKISKAILKDLFSIGEYMGLGQWRMGSFGRFKLISLEKIDS